jgi:serine/threonine protein kinase/Tfp pilus assembly protein PilF
MNNESAAREPLEELAESFLARFRAGERPALGEYEAQHPELAGEIRDLFPALVLMEEGRKCVEDRADSDPARLAGKQVPEQLGEYRLLRQIGRGGMGVVFEAWQESLGRHVALKVLPFNALVKPEHLERFRREARAAARLHHTHIVPVFGVGEDAGIHYYAMQFIHGQGLDAILQEVRRLRSAPGTLAPTPTATLVTSVALRLLNDTPQPARTEITRVANTGTPATLSLKSDSQYFAGVARIGLQVAEALDYAHGQGVIHRDVKPSNLLLDTEGRVWITDFGLAKTEDSEVLTQPGDILGTMRYMAPERFQGQADGRSDVYGLGITLYELLALRPAFAQANRGALIEEISRVEPTAPRRLDPRIPRDLETIVQKAMAKEPDRRYATAGEMAEDLRQFVADRPIRARRMSLPERLWRWRRHNPMVANLIASIAVLLLVIAGGVGWLARDRAARAAALDDELERAGDEAAAQIDHARWPEALAAVVRAEKLLASAGRSQRPARLGELQRDVDMASRLEDIYSQRGNEDFDFSTQQDAAYARAFREYRIDVGVLSPEEAAARIRARSIRRELALALDFWALVRQRKADKETPSWKRLLEIARLADPEKFRNRLRNALAAEDRKALVALAASADVRVLPRETLALLGGALVARLDAVPSLQVLAIGRDDAQTQEQVERFLRNAQRQYPRDLWITCTLAQYCRGRLQLDDAVRFYTAAVVLRPQNQHFVYALGDAFLFKGANQEAVTELSRVIEWNPKHLNAVLERGFAYKRLGQTDKMLEDFTRAIELRCQSPIAWYWRGWAYMHLRQWDKALADFSEDDRLWAAKKMKVDFSCLPAELYDPRYLSAYCFSVVGKWDRAAADLKTARLRLRPLASTPPDDTWLQLACLHLLQGDTAGYRQLCQQLLKRQPKEGFVASEAYIPGRTLALQPEGSAVAGQAVRLAEKALASAPQAPWFLHTLALAHYRAGQLDKAVHYAGESHQAGSQWGGTMVNLPLLALAHHRLGHLDEARKCRTQTVAWRKQILEGTYKGKAVAPPEMHLSDWLEFQLLYTEVVALMRPSD